ncbi:MAG TPA: GNAT family N-acetyltransferase [Acidimicrobiales bacterium]
MQQWGADRIEELTALVAAAAPGEDLSADELLTACYERPGVVLGPATGEGALALGLQRDRDGTLVAAVRLVVVHPEHRRSGVGRALLAEAEAWARDRGAERLELGGPTTFALWSGIEPDSALAALGAACGFAAGLEVRSYAVSTDFRAAPPEGVVVRRAVRDADVTAVTLQVAASWPQLSDEVARSLDHGTCHVAVVAEELTAGASPSSEGEPEIVGIGCHSVTRAGWVGPLVVAPAHRRRGNGLALLGQVCRDLMIAEMLAAHVPAVDTPEVDAFVLAAEAAVGPTRRPMSKDLTD